MKSPMARIPGPSVRGPDFNAARDQDKCSAYPMVCRPVCWRSCQIRACSVSLKNEMVDPAQSCISATVGLVTPTCLWGMNGIGAEVGPRASVVDQFWIRSASHSHGSTPDRKSRAVSSS